MKKSGRSEEKSPVKFYFQVTHDTDADGNCGKVIEVEAKDKFDAWRSMGRWQARHVGLENLRVVAFYGHVPGQDEIDANAKNSDTFFSYDVL